MRNIKRSTLLTWICAIAVFLLLEGCVSNQNSLNDLSNEVSEVEQQGNQPTEVELATNPEDAIDSGSETKSATDEISATDEKSEVEVASDDKSKSSSSTTSVKNKPNSDVEQSLTKDQGGVLVQDPSEPSEPSNLSNASQPSKPSEALVTITIVGDQERGTILAETEVKIKEGESVLDILKRVTREHKIHMEYRGRGALGYVEGIDNLYEFDLGSGSGWIYKVNGQQESKSPDAVRVKKGDIIEWKYSLELGDDV